MKQIKDYVHLHMGCDIMAKHKSVHIYHPYKLNSVWYDYVMAGNHDVQLVLRPLNDMTLTELKEFVLFGQPDIKAEESDYQGALDEIKENGIDVFKYNDIQSSTAFEHTRLLLSKEFDLYGLIDAGLAIDKTKQ